VRRALLVALAGALGGALGGAELAAQEPEAVPRYGAASGCFAYGEQVRAISNSEAGGRRRTVTVERAGILRLLVAPVPAGLGIEAWFDSLAVTVRAPEGDGPLDTSGLLGGRWRGTLDSLGTWHEAARPFVPDEIRAVMDLGALMEDFFPRGPDHRVIVQDDTLATPRGALAARTAGDEGRILEWGEGPLPRAWQRDLETVTTATGAAGEVLARVRLERRALVALAAGWCSDRGGAIRGGE
jgi:hypothetical protein